MPVPSTSAPAPLDRRWQQEWQDAESALIRERSAFISMRLPTSSPVTVLTASPLKPYVCEPIPRRPVCPNATEMLQALAVFKAVLPAGWHAGLLGPQSKVEWQGRMYSLEGEPMQYNGSRRTAHIDHVLVRSESWS
jgi:hypothetical protein